MDKNIRTFLESGQLELYILGTLNTEESVEVENLIVKYPVIRQEYEKLQEELEKISQANSIPPPEFMKKQIIDQLSPKLVEKSQFPKQSLLLLSSGILGLLCLYFVFQNQSLKKQVYQSQEEYAQLESQCISKDDQIASLFSERDMMLKSRSQKVVLNGNDKAPEFNAVFFCNPVKNELFISANLSELPENKCFQLWGDIDGKMIPLAILGGYKNNKLRRISYDPNMISLNVTIEDRLEVGGQDHPNVEQLIASAMI